MQPNGLNSHTGLEKTCAVELPDAKIDCSYLREAMAFPYTYFRCPCADNVGDGRCLPSLPGNITEQDISFDPHAPRANFSLFPLEHLMWCEECHEIRCSRCVIEEIVCWYCPSCLFEVASSVVKSEGNR